MELEKIENQTYDEFPVGQKSKLKLEEYPESKKKIKK